MCGTQDVNLLFGVERPPNRMLGVVPIHRQNKLIQAYVAFRGAPELPKSHDELLEHTRSYSHPFVYDCECALDVNRWLLFLEMHTLN